MNGTEQPTRASDPVADPAPPTPDTSPLHAVFFGRQGLRAGWGLLLFFAIFTALQTLVGWAAASLHPSVANQPRDVIGPEFALWGEGLAALIVLATTWAMTRLEHRTFGGYGLAITPRALPRFAAGAAWGLAFVSALVGSLRAAGLLTFEGRGIHGVALWGYAAEWLAAFLLVGFFEEVYFRGYLQATLTRGLVAIYSRIWPVPLTGSIPDGQPQPPGLRAQRAAFWTSAFVLSFGFGLVHTTNPGESPLGVFAAGAIGLVFCLSLWRTGSLWWAIGFHAAWDWGESYLWGVYDSGLLSRGRLFLTHPHGYILLSGGRTGPEGSLLIAPILAGTVLVILLTLRRDPLAPSGGAPYKSHIPHLPGSPGA